MGQVITTGQLKVDAVCHLRKHIGSFLQKDTQMANKDVQIYSAS